MEIIPHDLHANYQKILSAFKVAAKRKCNFLVLPEECWVGPGFDNKKNKEVAKFVKEKCSTLCKKYSIYCVAGSLRETDAKTGKIHNTSYLFDSRGNVVGSYSKMHLVPPKEEDVITPGLTHKVFDTEFGKVGIQICRDILYPEVTHTLANIGAKIIFSPAFWSEFSSEYKSSIKDYHANDELQMIKYLAPARALENEVIFVFVNAAGHFVTPERQDTLLGYSQTCEPFIGLSQILRNNKEQLHIFTVNTDSVDEMRSGWQIRGH